LTTEHSPALSRRHRDAIRRELLADVRALEAVGRSVYPLTVAKPLQLRLAENLHMLEDLAADRADDRDMFPLTMLRGQLTTVLARALDQAVEELRLLDGGVADTACARETHRSDGSVRRRLAAARELRDACLAALEALSVDDA
jgi:hypothetical protein